jgi:hypothetical protein
MNGSLEECQSRSRAGCYAAGRVDIEQDGAIEMSAGCRTDCRPPFFVAVDRVSLASVADDDTVALAFRNLLTSIVG